MASAIAGTGMLLTRCKGLHASALMVGRPPRVGHTHGSRAKSQHSWQMACCPRLLYQGRHQRPGLQHALTVDGEHVRRRWG